jgi:exodeoxyribonuclease VII small subunit
MEEKETYSKSIERLRAIVANIEKDELDIDELSEKVKEASRLIKVCKEKLYKADEEVKKILEELQ